MQLAVEAEGIESVQKRTRAKNVVLAPRDLEVIEFILDMKFASSEEIFEKFFKVTFANRAATNDLWAKKRLSQLEQGKFLRSVRAFSEAARYYIPTLKGYYALTQIHPEKFLTKPISGFDQRTFIHDKIVMKCRLLIESHLKKANWISERKLKSSTQLSCGLSSLDIPDGVFDHPIWGRVAFELEIAHKNQARYSKKVKRYVQLLRSREITENKFDCIVFVCLKATVRERLFRETNLFGPMFKVLSMEEFQQEIKGIKNENDQFISAT